MTTLDIQFLTVDEVVVLHREQVAAFGGTLGIRNPDALESAVAVVQAGFGGEYLHRDVFEMAAAYIAENQPFVDGNKRAALAAALTFLVINGVEIDDPDERLYDGMMEVAAHRLDKPGLAAVFRELSAPAPQDH